MHSNCHYKPNLQLTEKRQKNAGLIGVVGLISTHSSTQPLSFSFSKLPGLPGLLGLVISSLSLLLSPLAHAETLTRTSAFVYDADGVLVREVIEPNNTNLCVVTQYTLDAYGNRTSSMSRNCNGSAIPGYGTEASAPPAPPATASASANYAQFTSRSANTSYSATTANPTPGQFPTANTNAQNHSETQVFDPRFGVLTQSTGPNGITTRWQYDDFGRKTTEIRADGSKTHIQYLLCNTAPSGTCPTSIHNTIPYYVILTSHTNASGGKNGAPTRTYFDSLNRELRTQTQIHTSPTTLTWSNKDNAYDASGRVGFQTNAYLADAATGHLPDQNPSFTYNQYDILGRLTRQENHDSLAVNTANQVNSRYVRTIAYNGLSTSHTNTKGQTTSSLTNVAGQVATVTDPQGNTLTHKYDALGNTIQTNAAGVVTTIAYDLRGRKVSMTDPHMGTWQYRYDALGQLRLQQNAKGQLTTIAYDTLGRQTEKREPDLISTWAYDTHESACAGAPNTAKGKPTRATTSTGYERIQCYDNLGREISQRTAMDGKVFWSGVEYESGTGRVARSIYPARVQPNPAPVGNTAPTGGYSVRNIYDATGLIGQTNHATNAKLWEIGSLTKNADATVEKTLLGNGLTDQVYRDSMGRNWIDLVSTSANSHASYTKNSYDSENHLQSRLWRDTGTPSATTSYTDRTETFTYDSLNRLTGIVQSNTANANTTSKTLTYNAQGNILTKDGRTYSYANPAKPHQLTSVSGSVHGASNPSYTYDANGNLLGVAASTTTGTTTGTSTTNTTPSTTPSTTISWMSFDMVDNITQGSQSSSFRYGPEHQRVKQVANYNGQNITTWYVGSFELEYNASTNVTTAKNYVGKKVIHIETGTGATPASVQTQWLHTDHLGSVIAVSNSAGLITERYSFDAWGKRRNIDGTDFTANGGHLLGATDTGYTGHEQLDHLGLVHMNGRIYDPSLGRFMSADPFVAQAANLQNHNRYAYVNNNPLSYTDPSGYFLKKLFSSVRRAFFKAVGPEVGGFVVAIGSIFCGPYAPFCAAMGTYDNARANGVSSKDAFKSAAVAGATVYAAGQISAEYQSVAGVAAAPQAVALHAALGCVSFAVQGGQCGDGAITGAISKITAPYIELYAGSSNMGDVTIGAVASAIIGGTVSELTGGKFANGAITAAYAYMYNQLGRVAESAWIRSQAVARYRSGVGGKVLIDVETLDFSGLENDDWDKDNKKTFTFRNIKDYGVHGTVTINKTGEATFTVDKERYNNDHKPKLGTFHPRNVATFINRASHGEGEPFVFEFEGTRNFDNLKRLR